MRDIFIIIIVRRNRFSVFQLAEALLYARSMAHLDISLNESIASAEIEQHSRSILSSAHAGIEHPTL